MISKHRKYPASINDPMPGDLGVATISDINLPLLSSDVFGRSALIFGKVKCFTYVKGKQAMISAFGAHAARQKKAFYQFFDGELWTFKTSVDGTGGSVTLKR